MSKITSEEALFNNFLEETKERLNNQSQDGSEFKTENSKNQHSAEKNKKF